MTRTVCILAALLSAAPVAAAAQATPASSAPTVSFAITEEVKRAPDTASIGAGVTTQAATAVEAMRLNAEAMDRVVRAIKARGVPDRDIQTSGIALAPQYDYSGQQQGVPPRLTGYQVVNQVRVTTGDIQRLGPLLDALVVAGGTNIEGPVFSVANPDPGLDGARDRAVRRAADRAALYARAAGYARATLVSLGEEVGGDRPPMPMYRLAARSADAATPVQPGQVSSSITLTAQYRLER